jgi:hypothetical protein
MFFSPRFFQSVINNVAAEIAFGQLLCESAQCESSVNGVDSMPVEA